MGNPTLAQIKKICDILDLELIFQAKVTYPTNSVTTGIRIPQSAFKRDALKPASPPVSTTMRSLSSWVERTSTGGRGQPVEFTRSVFHAERIQFVARMRREG